MAADSPGRRWWTAAVVAALEAAAAAAFGIRLLLFTPGSDALLMALVVGLVALGVAAVLAVMCRAFWAGRRWPAGGFITVQVFVLVIAVSVGGPTLISPGRAPMTGAVTAAAVVLAALGLLGVASGLTAAAAPASDEAAPPEDEDDASPPGLP